MITPAVDLPAAPQMSDGLRAQSAQDGSSESGDFGTTFAASLSSSSTPVAANSDGAEAAVPQRLIQQNPIHGSNASGRGASTQKATVLPASLTSSKPAAAGNALARLESAAESAKNAAEGAQTLLAAAAEAKSSGSKAATPTSVKPNGASNTAPADLELGSKEQNAVAEKAGLAAASEAKLQPAPADVSRSLTTEVAENSKTSTIKTSDSATKTRTREQDAQAANGSWSDNALVASLATTVPALPVSTPANAETFKESGSVEAVNGLQGLPKQNAGALATGTASAADDRNTGKAKWVGVELKTTYGSAARAAASETGATDAAVASARNSEGAGPRSYFDGAAASAAGDKLSSAGQVATSPGPLLNLPLAAASGQRGVAKASSVPTVGTAGQTAATTNFSLDKLSPNASSATDIARQVSVVTPSSGVATKPQSSSVGTLASRSVNSPGQAGSAATGVVASATGAARGVAQSNLRHAVTEAGGSFVVDPSVGGAPNSEPVGNQQQAGLEVSVAKAVGTSTVKVPIANTEPVSTAHPAASGAGVASPAHRGSSDTSLGTNDGGVTNDSNANVVAVHGDSSVAVVSSHTVSAPVLNAASSSVAVVPNPVATAAHQVPAAAAGPVAHAAVGAVGSSTLQAAEAEAPHGAGALNGAMSSQPHQTLSSTPTSLEVGVHSGTQGWLKIRAEVGDQGDVSASLAASSSTGQQVLKGQLPALNAFLQSEQMSVTTSVAERIGAAHVPAAHEAGLGSLSAGTGSAGQDTSLLQSGMNQNAFAQSGGQQGGGLQTASSSAEPVRDDAVQSYASRAESSAASSTTHSDGSGRWLNVRV